MNEQQDTITVYDLSENQRHALQYIAYSADGQIYSKKGVQYWQLQWMARMELVTYERLDRPGDEWHHKFTITQPGLVLAQSIFAAKTAEQERIGALENALRTLLSELTEAAYKSENAPGYFPAADLDRMREIIRATLDSAPAEGNES